MAELLGLTGPLVGPIALGWAAVRFGAFDRAHLLALARFVIGFCQRAWSHLGLFPQPDGLAGPEAAGVELPL